MLLLNLVDKHVSQTVSPEPTHLGCSESSFPGEFQQVFGAVIQEMGGLIGARELTSVFHGRILLMMRDRM